MFAFRYETLNTKVSWMSLSQRNFAVKELPWCSKSVTKPKNVHVQDKRTMSEPIERFGIIAAMSKNNIIGLNGRLPWSVPDDRKEFVRITKNKILIVGRRTFEECNTLSHVSHASNCIVISKTLQYGKESSLAPNTEISIVQSFTDALDLARKLVNTKQYLVTDNSDVECWIAGGESVYNTAILHPSAWLLHLTEIDIDIIPDVNTTKITHFPPKQIWDSRFKLISESFNIDKESDIRYTLRIYKNSESL